MTLPATPQRQAWFSQESAKLQAAQVGKCSTAPAGTPSVCFVSIAGKNAQLKILLTRTGWMLVR
jgi:hypothetical protein